MKLKDTLKKWETVLPLSLQEKWDHCGLNLGHPDQDIKSVLFAYDVCHEVVREAAQKKCQLIISHHPFRMRGEVNIRTDSYDGKTIELCLKHGIALYSCHTNHDASVHSLNRFYLEKLGLTKIEPLSSPPQKLYKLTVFVPLTHTQKLLQGLFDAGAGTIGNYDECSFRTPGTGTFRGDENTNPTIGRRHHREEVPEEKIETIVPENRLSAVIGAMKQAHPYEEVAYDLYTLENKRSDTGLGAVGEWRRPLPQNAVLNKLQKIFGVPKIRFVKSGKKSFQRVALCTGSGMGLMDAALGKKAELFVTGDVKYHQAIEAKRQDLAVADVGHFHSEVDSVTVLKTLFDREFSKSLKTLEYKGLKDAFEFF